MRIQHKMKKLSYGVFALVSFAGAVFMVKPAFAGFIPNARTCPYGTAKGDGCLIPGKEVFPGRNGTTCPWAYGTVRDNNGTVWCYEK